MTGEPGPSADPGDGTPDGETSPEPGGEAKSETVFGADVGEWALATCVGGAGGAIFGVLIDDITLGVSLGVAIGVFYLLFWRSGKKSPK